MTLFSWHVDFFYYFILLILWHISQFLISFTWQFDFFSQNCITFYRNRQLALPDIDFFSQNVTTLFSKHYFQHICKRKRAFWGKTLQCCDVSPLCQMEMELMELHKSNTKLKLNVSELKLRLTAREKEMHKEKEKVRHGLYSYQHREKVMDF